MHMKRSPASGTDLWSYATLCIVILFWSGNFIVGRAVNGVIPPFTLALVRWSGALAILLPFAWRHLRADRQRLLSHWKAVLLLGLTGVAAFNAFIYSGLQFTTASNGLLLQAAIPALVLLFNRLFFGDRASALQIVGVTLSMLGVAVIVLRGDLAALARLTLNFGDFLVLCGVVCWALYTAFLRLRPDCHPASFLTATFVIGAAAMAPFAAMEVAGGASIPLRADVLGAFAYVALFPSLVAYVLYNAAVKNLGAAPAGQMITLMPLFGAGLAALLLGEALFRFHIIGMVLILGGIVLGAVGVQRQLRRIDDFGSTVSRGRTS
ncbi:drug/metabolite transporter (DMT)-like permease [Sphingobium sp. AEW010]|nr:drug/metabolite transporter (DMT)-like permease [Sphingobium sp. AEW010]TWD21887.1 drug/metabolite transporter (DMT)-like permease [Sphingobium sp. AEW013]TWD24597.1 drug/metabolite transporter (DMT)-like permease [Sphingobium sp. AEW001]